MKHNIREEGGRNTGDSGSNGGGERMRRSKDEDKA
jgi:hypothetical protein